MSQNPDSRPLPGGWITEYSSEWKTWYFVNTKDENPQAIWKHPASHDASTSASRSLVEVSQNPDTRPLPMGWISEYDEHYKAWYYVDTTQPDPISSWQHPLDIPENPDKRPLPLGWITLFDGKYGTWYYVKTDENPPVTIWNHPADNEDTQIGMPRMHTRSEYTLPLADQPPKPVASRKDTFNTDGKIQALYKERDDLQQMIMDELKHLNDLQLTIEKTETAIMEQLSSINIYMKQMERLEGEKVEGKEQYESSLRQSGASHATVMEILKEEYERNQKRIEEQTQRWADRQNEAKVDLQSLERSLSSTQDARWTIWRSLLVHEAMVKELISAIGFILDASSRSEYSPSDILGDMERITANLSETTTIKQEDDTHSIKRATSAVDISHSSEA